MEDNYFNSPITSDVSGQIDERSNDAMLIKRIFGDVEDTANGVRRVYNTITQPFDDSRRDYTGYPYGYNAQPYVNQQYNTPPRYVGYGWGDDNFSSYRANNSMPASDGYPGIWCPSYGATGGYR